MKYTLNRIRRNVCVSYVNRVKRQSFFFKCDNVTCNVNNNNNMNDVNSYVFTQFYVHIH